MRGKASQYFFHGDLFIAPDRIVASTDVDTSTGEAAGVHAFDRDTGRELWKHSSGPGVKGAVIGAGSRVFVYSVTGELIALNIDSGEPAWSYSLKAPVWESPAVVGTRVFAGSTDGSVYAFNTKTGRVEWQQKLEAPVNTSVRATDADVYAGTADGMLHRLSAASGQVRSSLKLDPALKPISAPLVAASAVIMLLTDQQADYRAVVSVDPDLGRVNWRRAAPDKWTTSRVFVSHGAVWLGDRSGQVTAYCAADGKPAWSHKLANGPIRSIGGSNDLLYVGTPQGSLFAIRPPKLCI